MTVRVSLTALHWTLLLVNVSCLTATVLDCYWFLSLTVSRLVCYWVLSLTVTLLDCYRVLSLTVTLLGCYRVLSLAATLLACYWVLSHCHSSWLLLSCLSQPHFLFVVDSHLPLGRLNTSVSDWPLRCRFQPPCFQMQLLCQLENSQIEITPLNMYNKFVERIRRNLHVVLAFSPIGDAFRNRLRMFPSLINCCTIDWFKVSEGDGRWWLV